jgi:hypothetical protein
VRIAEILTEESFWECPEHRCHKISATSEAVNHRFSLTHTGETLQGWEVKNLGRDHKWTLMDHEDSDVERIKEISNGESVGGERRELEIQDQIRPRQANEPNITIGGNWASE